MKSFRPLLVIFCVGLLSFQQPSDSDELNSIIAKYEADREYEFDSYESVENTTKYYQAEADFSKKLKEELKKLCSKFRVMCE